MQDVARRGRVKHKGDHDKGGRWWYQHRAVVQSIWSKSRTEGSGDVGTEEGLVVGADLS